MTESPTDALRLVPVEPTEAMVADGVKAAQRAEQTCVSWPEMALFTYRAMLAAAPASPLPEGGGWQDISTAPKDGTPILITRPTRFMSEEGYHVVRWDDEQWCCHDGKFDTWLRGSDPTHWMPLPAAPRGDARNGKGEG